MRPGLSQAAIWGGRARACAGVGFGHQQRRRRRQLTPEIVALGDSIGQAPLQRWRGIARRIQPR